MLRLVIFVMLVLMPLNVTAQEVEIQSVALKAFVYGIQADSSSYSVAKVLAQSEITNKILVLLGDPSLVHYLPNITMLIGVSGRSGMARPLINFVEGRNSDVGWSLPVYRGRTSAIMALGYLVHEAGGNREAMQYLIESVDPRIWAEREISWLFVHPDRERLSLQLSTSALVGLALTGRDEARDVLNRVIDNQSGRIQEVALAMRHEWGLVNKSGLEAYYNIQNRITQ